MPHSQVPLGPDGVSAKLACRGHSTQGACVSHRPRHPGSTRSLGEDGPTPLVFRVSAVPEDSGWRPGGRVLEMALGPLPVGPRGARPERAAGG